MSPAWQFQFYLGGYATFSAHTHLSCLKTTNWCPGVYDILPHSPRIKWFVGTLKQLWLWLSLDISHPVKEILGHPVSHCCWTVKKVTTISVLIRVVKGGFLGSSNSGHRMDSFSLLCAPWVTCQHRSRVCLLPQTYTQGSLHYAFVLSSLLSVVGGLSSKMKISYLHESSSSEGWHWWNLPY